MSTGFKQYSKKCLECQKVEVFLNGPNDVGFCSRMCEVNHKYRMKRMDLVTGERLTAEQVRKNVYGPYRSSSKNQGTD